MQKGSDTKYCCQYCSKIFFDKIQLIENIANQHKKCGIYINTFPSEKVLKTNTHAVNKKVQLSTHLSGNQAVRIIKQEAQVERIQVE